MTCRQIAESQKAEYQQVTKAAKDAGFTLVRGRNPTEFNVKDTAKIVKMLVANGKNGKVTPRKGTEKKIEKKVAVKKVVAKKVEKKVVKAPAKKAVEKKPAVKKPVTSKEDDLDMMTSVPMQEKDEVEIDDEDEKDEEDNE